MLRHRDAAVAAAARERLSPARAAAAGRSRPPALTSLITMITLVSFPHPIVPAPSLPPFYITSVLKVSTE